MAIDAVAPGGANAAQAQAQGSLSKLNADYQSFLKLLTAQISNQDPLKPMDSTTFVTQLAQLSQVEQSVTTNTNLERIASEVSNLGALSELALIGSTVVAPSDKTQLDAVGATVLYRTGADAAAATVTIRDSDGNAIRVLDGLPAGGDQMRSVAWDGTDAGGTALPQGNYTVEITARDGDGDDVTAQTFARSRVDRMSFDEGSATLHLANGDDVTAGNVESIE